MNCRYCDKNYGMLICPCSCGYIHGKCLDKLRLKYGIDKCNKCGSSFPINNVSRRKIFFEYFFFLIFNFFIVFTIPTISFAILLYVVYFFELLSNNLWVYIDLWLTIIIVWIIGYVLVDFELVVRLYDKFNCCITKHVHYNNKCDDLDSVCLFDICYANETKCYELVDIYDLLKNSCNEFDNCQVNEEDNIIFAIILFLLYVVVLLFMITLAFFGLIFLVINVFIAKSVMFYRHLGLRIYVVVGVIDV